MTIVASPCIDVCRMDAASGCCEGCQRTLAEIAAWGGMSDAAKRAVWQALPARREAWQRCRAGAAQAAGPAEDGA